MNRQQIDWIRWNAAQNKKYRHTDAYWEEDVLEEIEPQRSKRLERIRRLKEANDFVDQLFKQKFAPKIFKELEFEMEVDRITKIRKLEAVLPTGMLLQMRACVPGRLIRLAYESKTISVPGEETGDTEDEIELRVRAVQRKTRSIKSDVADVKRRRYYI